MELFWVWKAMEGGPQQAQIAQVPMNLGTEWQIPYNKEFEMGTCLDLLLRANVTLFGLKALRCLQLWFG